MFHRPDIRCLLFPSHRPTDRSVSRGDLGRVVGATEGKQQSFGRAEPVRKWKWSAATHQLVLEHIKCLGIWVCFFFPTWCVPKGRWLWATSVPLSIGGVFRVGGPRAPQSTGFGGGKQTSTKVAGSIWMLYDVVFRCKGRSMSKHHREEYNVALRFITPPRKMFFFALH